MVSDTIDVSSTTMTSCGSRLPRWWRNRDDVSGRGPSSRCSVVARSPASRCRSASSSVSTSSATASCSRAAALPVGAANAIRSGGRPAVCACSASSASSRATVVVLPVPGPPVSTVTPCDNADFGRGALLVVAGREQPLDVRGAVGGPGAQQRQQIVGDLLLLAPVPVQIQQLPVQAQHRRVSQQRAGPHRGRPVPLGPATAGPSTPTCVRTARRSTHTEPPRSAAHRQRDRQRHPLVGLPGQRANRCATCTSEASSTPASLNSASTPARPDRPAPLGRVDDLGASRRPARMQQIGQLAHQRRRRPPAEHPGRMPVGHRGVRAAHAAHEQVRTPPRCRSGV